MTLLLLLLFYICKRVQIVNVCTPLHECKIKVVGAVCNFTPSRPVWFKSHHMVKKWLLALGEKNKLSCKSWSSIILYRLCVGTLETCHSSPVSSSDPVVFISSLFGPVHHLVSRLVDSLIVIMIMSWSPFPPPSINKLLSLIIWQNSTPSILCRSCGCCPAKAFESSGSVYISLTYFY